MPARDQRRASTRTLHDERRPRPELMTLVPRPSVASEWRARTIVSANGEVDDRHARDDEKRARRASRASPYPVNRPQHLAGPPHLKTRTVSDMTALNDRPGRPQIRPATAGGSARPTAQSSSRWLTAGAVLRRWVRPPLVAIEAHGTAPTKEARSPSSGHRRPSFSTPQATSAPAHCWAAAGVLSD